MKNKKIICDFLLVITSYLAALVTRRNVESYHRSYHIFHKTDKTDKLIRNWKKISHYVNHDKNEDKPLPLLHCIVGDSDTGIPK